MRRQLHYGHILSQWHELEDVNITDEWVQQQVKASHTQDWLLNQGLPDEVDCCIADVHVGREHKLVLHLG